MEKIVRVNAAKLKSFDDAKFAPQAVYQSQGIKVILAYFKEGQFIPVHSSLNYLLRAFIFPSCLFKLCLLNYKCSILDWARSASAINNHLPNFLIPDHLRISFHLVCLGFMLFIQMRPFNSYY